jgi:hypothetical protein
MIYDDICVYKQCTHIVMFLQPLIYTILLTLALGTWSIRCRGTPWAPRSLIVQEAAGAVATTAAKNEVATPRVNSIGELRVEPNDLYQSPF